MPKLSDGLIKSFVKDARRAIDTLDPIAKYDGALDVSTVKNYTIQAHAMKSALANIGRPMLSKIAAILEKAGRESDIDTIRAETLHFIERLEEILGEITPEEESSRPENPALLVEQLRVLAAACDGFDKKGARTAIGVLNSNPMSAETKEFVDEVSLMLLRGEFEDAAEMAKQKAEKVFN